MTHYLTRAVIDKNAPEHALRPLLDPSDETRALDAHRRLIWTLFPSRDNKRDFLWRADGRGKFLIMSTREPRPSRLFKPIETKPYQPLLSSGDRLSFVLRANATKDRRSRPDENTVAGTKRKPTRDKRVDVVMHTMKERGIKGGNTGIESRSGLRMEIAREAASSWIMAQGERRGFEVTNLVVEDYRVSSVSRGRKRNATFGILDLKGELIVRDPEKLKAALVTGLGRAKAFGCGLLMVRRI